MAKGDFYPRSADARNEWHKLFSATLPDFATKYDISADDQTQAAEDSEWFDWIVDVKAALSNYSQQVTKYFNDIAGNDPTKDPPMALANFTLPTPPTQPPPGIESRTREWARQIKGDTEYSEADGQALGIEGPVAAPTDPATMTPDFTAKTLANFELEIGFRKQGMDALKLQFRYKGGDWQSAGFLVTSPGVISIPPTTAGTGEQIELRAVFIEKNNEVGSYTDAKPAFIAP